MKIQENRLIYQERKADVHPSAAEEAARKAADTKKAAEAANKAATERNKICENGRNCAKVAEKGAADSLTKNKKANNIDRAEIARKFGYDEVGEFNDGVAVAVKKGQYCVLVDRNGQEVGGKYWEIEEFHDGIAIAHDLSGEDDHQIIFINKLGKPINYKFYFDAHPFSEGLAGVKEKGKKWIFIDKKGNELKNGKDKLEFDEVYQFSHGIAGVRNGNRWRYLNNNGTFLNDKTYDKVEDFEGDYAYAKRGGKEYLVFFTGQEIENTPAKASKKPQKIDLDNEKKIPKKKPKGEPRIKLD